MQDFRRELLALLPRLRRFALALCRTQHDADDLVQAAVERALRHGDAWQQGSQLDSWMFKIIQNLWRDELRAHRRRAEPLDAVMELAGEDGREVMLQHIQRAEARAALAALPEEQRAVVALVVLEGKSYREAAAILEVAAGTIMSRLARARAKLASSLDQGTRKRRAVQ